MARFNNLGELKKHLAAIGYPNIKDKDTRSVFVLTNDNRTTVFQSIVKQLGGRVNPQRTFGGSLGHIDVDGFRIAVKPLSRQGTMSSGVGNEINLTQAINYMVQQYGLMDVIFTDGRNKFVCKDVRQARQVGADTANRKKADVVVEGKTKYSVSLKQDNAEYWESADSFWRDKAAKYLDQAIKAKKIEVQSISGGAIKITPSIGIQATVEEATDVIFGSDLGKDGCVVTRTFVGDDFTYDGKTNTLTIDCTSVITSIRDVPSDKEVWFLIRNDSTRKSIPQYPGVRVLAAYKSRINSNVVKVTRSERRD